LASEQLDTGDYTRSLSLLATAESALHAPGRATRTMARRTSLPSSSRPSGRPDSEDDDDFDDEGADFGPPRGAQGISAHHVGEAPPIYNRASWRGFDGWTTYFPDENETDECCGGRSVIVAALREFFLTEAGRALIAGVPDKTFSLPLNYDAMRRPTGAVALRKIGAVIIDTPDEALRCIGLAASRAAEEMNEEASEGTTLPVQQHNRLWPRIYNLNPITPLRSLRGNSVGKFVAVRGTVVRVSNIRQQVTSMQFECTKCGDVFGRQFADYKYNPPTSCPTDKCRSRTFLPKRETAETIDWQKIRIQEIVDQDDSNMSREEGRMPRTIDSELFADLIDSCIPGDVVTICGTVRVLSVEVAGGGGGGNGAGGSAKATKAGKCLFYLYLEANSTDTTRSTERKSAAIAAATFDDTSDSAVDARMHEVIRNVVREKDPFAFLVHSAVPSIYGHELVKAGMLLSLFGGSAKKRVGGQKSSEKDDVAIRRDVHCLVVGDPGLGKSQMLKAVSNIAPRGVYVCGNTTTTAGLTVTVVRDASGDFALEAGALVLGDRGVCCIDEFDKMGADHCALLEAMEQQSVSVAKAGMLCNLSARTTVIAAANPVGGHYDRSKTVCENLKIALPLLSRFDLVYILMDNPDAERDRFISEHVMAMFGMRAAERRGGFGRDGNRGPASERTQTTTANLTTLIERLRHSSSKDPLPPSLFRQYIAYAKAHCHPELSEDAKRVLQEFYLTLRKGAHEQAADTTPITTRQLESLIRLSEARARAVMRSVVTESDARDVIEIMRESMLETLTDETGQIDLGRSSGMSRSRDARLFVAALHAEGERIRSALFDTTALTRVANSIGIDSGARFDTLVETINYQGYLTMKGRGRYELKSSSFSLTPSAHPRNNTRGGGYGRTQGSQAQGAGSQRCSQSLGARSQLRSRGDSRGHRSDPESSDDYE
jgi:DNA helicase MCM8